MTRPSNDAIAQAFWEWVDKNWSIGEVVLAPADLLGRAYDIDTQRAVHATQCAKSDNHEVSGASHSEFVLVPREPTEAMVDAGNEGAAPYMVNARDLWNQMLDAAPTPPKQEAVGKLLEVVPGIKNVCWFVTDLPAGTKLYAAQPAPTTDDDVRRDAASCALRELATQFIEMSQAASRDGEPTRCDVWANAASQATFRSKDSAWIDAAILEASTTAREDVMSKSKAKRVAAQKGESSGD